MPLEMGALEREARARATAANMSPRKRNAVFGFARAHDALVSVSGWSEHEGLVRDVCERFVGAWGGYEAWMDTFLAMYNRQHVPVEFDQFLRQSL